MLGELAQAQGLLSAAQAQEINTRQRREDRRFGDIARELGLLTAAQVDLLLEQQKARRKLFGEILVEQGTLDRATLEAELAAHQADRAEALSALEDRLDGHPLRAMAEGTMATCTRLFPRLLRTQAQFSALLCRETLEAYPVCAWVRVEAERPLAVALACDMDTAAAFSGAFLSIPSTACVKVADSDGAAPIRRRSRSAVSSITAQCVPGSPSSTWRTISSRISESGASPASNANRRLRMRSRCSCWRRKVMS